MERFFVLGANHKSGAIGLSYKRRFEIVGRNTGNMLIGNALYQQLMYAKWGGGSIADHPMHIRRNWDRIVLPAANFLHRNFDFSTWADLIESVDLPCFMVGLGAQAPCDSELITDIPKGTIRFIRAVADRTRSIGVRGYYTADVLEKLGIINIDVVGCPSFYTNNCELLYVRKKNFEEIKKVVITGSANVIEHSYDPAMARQVEQKFFRLADTRNFSYVLQSELPEILYIENLDEGQKPFLIRATNTMNYSSVDEYASVIRRVGKVFFDVQKWFDWMRNQDLVIGTRLHGAVAGMLQGVPSIIIYHDTRTKETSELMHFPCISLLEAKSMSLEAIYEGINFERSNKRYINMLSRYINFIEKNGIRHKFSQQLRRM